MIQDGTILNADTAVLDPSARYYSRRKGKVVRAKVVGHHPAHARWLWVECPIGTEPRHIHRMLVHDLRQAAVHHKPRNPLEVNRGLRRIDRIFSSEYARPNIPPVPEQFVIDLMTDIRHYCHAQGLDFRELAADSLRFWKEEA